MASQSLKPRRGGHRLDVDAHAIDNNKKDARHNYKQTKGYMPLVSFVGRYVVEVEMRNGNTSPGKGILPHVSRTIVGLAEKGIQITKVVSDAAGYQWSLMN